MISHQDYNSFSWPSVVNACKIKCGCFGRRKKRLWTSGSVHSSSCPPVWVLGRRMTNWSRCSGQHLEWMVAACDCLCGSRSIGGKLWGALGKRIYHLGYRKVNLLVYHHWRSLHLWYQLGATSKVFPSL